MLHIIFKNKIAFKLLKILFRYALAFKLTACTRLLLINYTSIVLFF